MLATTLRALALLRAPGEAAADTFKRCWIDKAPLVRHRPATRIDRLPAQRASPAA